MLQNILGKIYNVNYAPFAQQLSRLSAEEGGAAGAVGVDVGANN